MTTAPTDSRASVTFPAHLSVLMDALERDIVHVDDLSVPDHEDLGSEDGTANVPGSPEPPD
jgi:hypothetical protein